MTNRIKKIFSDRNKKLVTFVTGGDPNLIDSIPKALENYCIDNSTKSINEIIGSLKVND